MTNKNPFPTLIFIITWLALLTFGTYHIHTNHTPGLTIAWFIFWAITGPLIGSTIDKK